MPDVLPFAEVPADSVLLVGGKGLSLARMAAAGLPVPPGFVVTTDAHRSHGNEFSDSLRKQVFAAYAVLGGGLVAVRSSATAEDGAETSFAGQQETILGVDGEEALFAAIQCCWQSLFAGRAVAYRRAQGIADDKVAIAVVVQKLVNADVAGVLFTRDPIAPNTPQMCIEAAWGLGEAVVSGRVTPDRFRVDWHTGTATDQHAGVKSVRITAQGEEAVPAELQSALCLTDAQLAELAELGRKVETLEGDPRDIEWAFADGGLYLLQARPITARPGTERETIRQEIQAELRKLAGSTETVWVRYNLSETLPEPTPLTWDILRVLQTAAGGFGHLHRDLGGDPDPTLGDLGAFDLIAGRPMANLARMPRLQFRRPPIAYPLAAYKRNPRQALDPEPELKPLRGGLFRLPFTLWRLSRIASRTTQLTASFDQTFQQVLAPAFAAEARVARSQDLSLLSNHQLLDAVHDWTTKTNIDFARHSLKPTVFVGLALQNLTDILKPRLKERTKEVLCEVAGGAKSPTDCGLADGIRALANGTWSREEFLFRFGHRCGGEMELARPRWSEDATAVDALRASLPSEPAAQEDPWPRLAKEARLMGGPIRKQADYWVERLRTYLGLREAGKHYWLMGIAVIRQFLVELDRRFQLYGGLFFLNLADLQELIAGHELTARISARKKRWQLERTLEVPPVLFSDHLDAVGRALPLPDGATTLEGIALAAGVAEGPALVLTEPVKPPDSPFVLVCPSTDPAWVPLFAQAKAVVMESGGVLSHGAIVAREFGLPAVAGLPGVVSRLKTGQLLRVDGTRGVVSLLD